MTKKVLWFPITCKKGINPNSSSARIRGRWVFDKLEGAVNAGRGLWCLNDFDVIVFQKWCDETAVSLAFEAKSLGKKVVLDMCDPTWLDIGAVGVWTEMIKKCDLVVFSTEELQKAFVESPYCNGTRTAVVPDRHDLNEIGRPLFKQKKSFGDEIVLLWHGHQRNIGLLRKIIPQIQKVSERHNIKLKVVPEFVIPGSFKNCGVATQVKWDEEQIYDFVREADVVLNPKCSYGEFAFKSDNKSSLAVCLGTKVIEMDVFSEDWEKAIVETIYSESLGVENVKKAREEYDVWKSVEEWKRLLEFQQ